MTQIREGGVEIPAGMKEWTGGDAAPADWDPHGEVMWDAPEGYTRTGVKSPHHQWKHGVDGWYDIIAYTPTHSPEIAEQPMGGEAKLATSRASDPDAQPEGTAESLAQCAAMLEQWGPDCFPANEHGQVDFARCMTDAVASEIRAFLANMEKPA